MPQNKILHQMINHLRKERTENEKIVISQDTNELFNLWRSLANIRPPKPISVDYLQIEDAYLTARLRQQGVVPIEALESYGEGLYLWQGDITCLAADAIVNAANNRMLGCFYPCHGCIDNAIHTFSGVRLRLACAEIMQQQGHEELTGQAKMTPAFNLPSKYILHTVGPIISGKVTRQDCERLSSCYRSCLKLADEHQLKSIAFCCVSTGEFHFPNHKAAEIAVQTVRDYRLQTNSKIKVIYNVYKNKDYEIYKRLLG